MKHVLVVMGGPSAESTVSLQTGSAVTTALRGAGYTVTPYTLTNDISDLLATLHTTKPDVVFNALHGLFGEDGGLPALLNMMHIPYTHSGVTASAIAMNKALTRRLAESAGLTVAPGHLIDRDTFLAAEPPFPYVIKPYNNGSSIGVHLVHTPADRAAALDDWPLQEQRLVETYIPGRELAVAVLGDEPAGIIELIPDTGFYDFNHKYTAGSTRHIVNPDLPASIRTALMDQALRIHRLLGCRAISRTDFRLDDITDSAHPRIVFLEVNTHPGMTDLSLVPDIVRGSLGWDFAHLVSFLTEAATCDA